MMQLFDELVLPFVHGHEEVGRVLLGGKTAQQLTEVEARQALWPVRGSSGDGSGGGGGGGGTAHLVASAVVASGLGIGGFGFGVAKARHFVLKYISARARQLHAGVFWQRQRQQQEQCSQDHTLVVPCAILLSSA
jgi:hypothetical protein